MLRLPAQASSEPNLLPLYVAAAHRRRRMNSCVHMRGGFIVSASTIQQASVLTGRQMVLVGVVGLHALVIAALMTVKIAVDRPEPTHSFQPISSVPMEPLPPEPRPTLETKEVVQRWTVPDLPRPDITQEEYRWVQPDIGRVSTPAQDAVAPTVTNEGGTNGVPASELRYRATRSPDDFYPATSVTLQEEGTAVVRVCVAPSGRLEGAPVIERSSGFRRLDAAAVQWAREALDFTAATRNGAAVSACKGFRVNFKLR